MNEQILDDFLGQVLNDLGGAFSLGLVRIGTALGLYKTLQARGPMTSVELAETIRYWPGWAPRLVLGKSVE